jgi:hypothetical protein
VCWLDGLKVSAVGFPLLCCGAATALLGHRCEPAMISAIDVVMIFTPF